MWNMWPTTFRDLLDPVDLQRCSGMDISFSMVLHASAHLQDAVAMLARHLANAIVGWENICALMASRLIVLDKCPGVHPISIGEALQ